MRKTTQKENRVAAPGLPYQDWLIEQLKDPFEAVAYLEAVIEEGDQAAIKLALHQVAQAQGGVAEIVC
jgi:DNA-binding phage protein